MRRAVAIALASCLLGGNAVAAELIQNGSFEDTNGPYQAVGWTTTGYWEFFNGGAQGPHSGTKNANGQGCYTLSELPNCTLSQTIATEIGQTYELSFWVSGYSFQGIWGAVQVLWDGEDLGPTYVSFVTKQVKMQVTATSASTLLQFRSANSYTNNQIDDVSLTPFTVPEPSTWALLIMGFAGAGGALRQRRGSAKA